MPACALPFCFYVSADLKRYRSSQRNDEHNTDEMISCRDRRSLRSQ